MGHYACDMRPEWFESERKPAKETPQSLPQRLRGRGKPGPRRYTVDDRRNSVSAAPLSRLDWTTWFTDGTNGGLYLHVWAKDGETCHRVFCRHSDTPRLSCEAGLLCWLVDDRKA